MNTRQRHRTLSTTLFLRVWMAFRYPLLVFLVVMLVGSFGYWAVSEFTASLLDCVYMTFITVATIGFGETIDLTHSPGGRIFTMGVATAGIATVTYTTSKLTAFILEGELNTTLRRRRMQDRIDAMNQHYIICGVGRVGSNVARELTSTGRKWVAIEENHEVIEALRDKDPAALIVHGDAQDDELLARVGLERAAGVFAVTGDDGRNLLITLSAKQQNPSARLVARCHEVRNIDKLKRVGADAIVSPDFTGGMRIVSSMIRPAVVSFLDEMLRSEDKLRVEEITLPADFVARTLDALLAPSREHILLAVKEGTHWEFNPAGDFRLEAGHVLVAMVKPHGRDALVQLVHRAAA
jgi:voltage-gated potassium channel